MADYNKQMFNEGCDVAFDEEHWQKMNYSTGCYENNFAKGKVNYRNMDLEKQRACILRNKSMMKLEKMLLTLTFICAKISNVVFVKEQLLKLSLKI